MNALKCVAVLAGLFSVTAQASNWQLVSTTTDQFVYVEMNSIRVQEKWVKVWIMADFKLPRAVADYPKKEYRSIQALNVIDCATRMMGTMQLQYYAAARGGGGIVHSTYLGSNPEEVLLANMPPDDPGEAIIELICRNVEQRGR